MRAIDRRTNAVSQTRFINPATLGKPPGYTHVVEVTAPARIVYIAGQLGIDKEGKLSSDFRLQAVQTFENLKNALAAVGGQFQHVVKLNNYLVDMKYLSIFRHVRDSFLSDKPSRCLSHLGSSSCRPLLKPPPRSTAPSSRSRACRMAVCSCRRMLRPSPIAISSLRLRPGTVYRRSTHFVFSSWRVVSCPTESTLSTPVRRRHLFFAPSPPPASP